MFRIDDATAATSLPAPEAAGTEGYFTEGNPTAGTPATNVRGSWLNMIQEELCAILAAAGITRSKTSYSQVNTALQKMYAPVIGSARNLAMSVTAASATATLTADEIIVASALGGQPYKLASFSKTINLGTTGAGGMDTGTAPVSGYVALYAIYNPTTQTAALLAKNATSGVQPNVYGGANMPAGYTASALVSVWQTNASGQFVIGSQRDRRVSIIQTSILNTNTIQASYTSLSISGALPANAISAVATIQVLSNTVGTTQTLFFAGDANGIGAQNTGAACSVANNGVNTNGTIPIITAQTVFWKSSNVGGGTPTFSASISAYDF